MKTLQKLQKWIIRRKIAKLERFLDSVFHGRYNGWIKSQFEYIHLLHRTQARLYALRRKLGVLAPTT